MGTNTKIEWTASRGPDGALIPGHTWNCWRGCEKVSDGCEHCYAETMSKRNPAVLGVWGPDGKRAIASEEYWQLPLKWNRAAERDGCRHRVFSLSLGDWLENRPELIAPRQRMLATIADTPSLDWLLLTKRIDGWDDRMAEVADGHPDAGQRLATSWQTGTAPPNVWLGVSAEDQATADARIPLLLQTPAAVRFVSAEPLLGPIDLDLFVHVYDIDRLECGYQRPLDWMITGGESGPGARPANPLWFRSIRDQCLNAGVAYFHKQHGEYVEWDGSQSPSPSYRFTTPDATPMVRVGKHAAGRVLDGREWSEFPEPPHGD